MRLAQYRRKLGARLVRFRTEAGLMQLEVAARAEITRQYLWRMERGDADPSLSKLHRLAAVFGVTVSELTDV